MRISLMSEGHDDVLTIPIPKLTATSSDEDKASHKNLEEKKRGTVSTSGIYVTEILSTKSHSWVLDTGCGSHIISNVQGLRNRRRLQKGEIDLHVGNGARVVALAIEDYSLPLPSGLVLELYNCYFVPSITKYLISISVLNLEGYDFVIKNCFFIYNNDIFYARAHMSSSGLYILDIKSEIYNVDI